MFRENGTLPAAVMINVKPPVKDRYSFRRV